MKSSQEALITACKRLGIPYKILHKHRIVVKVELNPPLYFYHHFKPFNREDIVKICKDKDLSYAVLSEHIKIPKWKSYLDPNCNPKYQDLCLFRDYESIIGDIIKNFNLPVIIKRNFGSQGYNVFKCSSKKEIKAALLNIYNREDRYDYIAVAQQYIDIKSEYRVNFYKGKALLTYEKSTKKAKYTGNLSPLHWEDSKAILTNDENLIKRFEDFMKPVFENIPIQFTGSDIAIDHNNELHLIELNSSPGIAIFERDNGLELVVKMYEYILNDLNLDSKNSS